MPSKSHQARYNAAKTPKTAAAAFHAWLVEWAKETECADVDGIGCFEPGYHTDAWCVSMDGGPYEGLVKLSGGEPMTIEDDFYLYAEAFGEAAARAMVAKRRDKPEFDLNSNPHIFVEPVNHWLLGFYPA